MLDDGESREAIMQRLRCDSRFISRWSCRFWPSDWRVCMHAILDELPCIRLKSSRRAF
ncbi:hypothetical protein SB822_48180 [Paraburkholderia sp. SIMBA_054]